MKIRQVIIALLVLCCGACDNSTDSLGIYTDSDNINASSSIYEAHTRSIVADSVLSNSNSSYLGQVTDKETGLKVKAEFLAQFSTLEDYNLPAYDLIVKDENGNVVADSIEIRLYYEKYYGKNNIPMKLSVYELDTTNVIREDSVYYSNADLKKYINKKADGPLVQKVFTARDFTVSDDVWNSGDYAPNIRIVLPKEYGTHILNKYYENKDFFKNSYNFIHHVCPGFYFQLTDGDGTLVKMRVGTLNVYFKYDDAVKDTTYVGMSRFASTPEVMQNTYIENDELKTWLKDKTDCTHLITPAGIFTEMTLPINEIYNGHENDSINQAQLTLYRYNAVIDAEEAMDIPQNILMVRKKDMYSFFEKRQVPNGKTSFYSTFNASYNTYNFSNIGKLISHCHNDMKASVKQSGLSQEEWTAKNEDWNKVVLIPVEMTIDDNNNIVSTTNDMSLASARLMGGTDHTIKLQVIYSSFQ
ncbi:MAG: DUF4270 domain-containing protein [Paraprevotella sp.]|nr:DUF4270 domain-containing protein [Paraprevotella sp.]